MLRTSNHSGEEKSIKRPQGYNREERGGEHLRGARGRDLERRSAYWRSSGTISRWCRHKSRHHVHVARPHSTPPINFLISPAGAPSPVGRPVAARSSREERQKAMRRMREWKKGMEEKDRLLRDPLFGVEHLVSILSDTRSTSLPRLRCIRISRRSARRETCVFVGAD